MNHFYILLLFVTSFGFAQIPAGYYDSATGSGYTLKTQLKSIISTGHDDQGYGALLTGYLTTDTDSYYEGDGTVLDMYSEDPIGVDPYNYSHNVRNCGNYDSENDCYNREHIFPQGFFDQQYPMRSDILQVVPSDGYVNGRRSNYPFGEVSSPTWTSMNGSKVGANTTSGYSGTVFEPIDEFKGDIARMLLYFAVRYEDNWNDSGWDTHTTANNPLNGTSAQFYETWYINLLYSWHIQDGVSFREQERNDAAYTYQGNRNPFVDHSGFVLNVWGNVLSTKDNSSQLNVSLYPNPLKGDVLNIKTTYALQVEVYDVLGKRILKENIDANNKSINVSSLNKGIYLVRLTTENMQATKKLIKQ